MELIRTRVLDDATQLPTYDRPSAFLETLASIGVSPSGLDVADLGTGFGSLALAAATRGATRVFAIDANPERIAEVSRRAMNSGLPVDCRVGNLLEPLTCVPPVDLVFLIGVVEYAGLWDLSTPVGRLQQRILDNAYSILKPSGTLIFASKNRCWPSFAIKDIHTGQPCVNILPRVLADRVSAVMSGRPYREHIHSPSGWRRKILQAGFKTSQVFYPYFSYQYPLKLTESPTLADLRTIDLNRLPDEIRGIAGARFPKVKVMLAALTKRTAFPMTQSILIRAVR